MALAHKVWMTIIAMGAAFCALTAPARANETGESAQPGSAEHILITYNGRFLGLRVMKTVLRLGLNADAYLVRSEFRTVGLLGFFKDAEILANAEGARAEEGFAPHAYEHRNLKSKKNRVIKIDFPERVATASVTPGFGEESAFAPEEDRIGALDPISALTSIGYAPGDTCDRTVPVYDGKQRYDLRLVTQKREKIRTRGWEGEALRCDLYYDPISGFDPEDLAEPEVYERPFQIWFAEIADGHTVPVRLRGRVNGISVSVNARRVEITRQFASVDPE